MSKISPSRLGHMGRVLFALALTISVLAGLGLAGQERVSAQGEVVSIDPADQEVSRGETFTVDVMISGAEDLASYEFTLAFDPDILEATGVVDAGFLQGTVTDVEDIDNENGTLTFLAISTGATELPDGDGVLATVTFEAIGSGTSALDLQDVSVFSGAEERFPTAEDGSVTSLFAIAVPEETIVNPGTFTVDVMIYGAMDLEGYEFSLDFNPNVLQVADVADAGFLQGTVTPATDIDNENGTLTFLAISTGATELPDGDGILATITFDTVDYGMSDLDLYNLGVSSGGTPETPDDMDGVVYVVEAGVSVLPEETSVSKCATFEVELVLGGDDVTDVTGFDINLDWDATLFEVTDITYGSFLEDTGRTGQELIKDINNTTGTLNYAVATLGDGAGPDAPGVLAVVEFVALEVGGPSALDLNDVEISYSGFTVAPAALNDGTAEATKEAVAFEFSAIADQVAGAPFPVTITALNEDELPAENFSGLVTLSDTTGTLTPTEVEFDGPEATANMTITMADTEIIITAEGTNACAVAISGDSNAFAVEPDIDNPVDVTIDPAEVMLYTGECQAFTLTGEDPYGNLFDATGLAGTTFTADGGGTVTGNEFCAEIAGSWMVTGTYLGLSDMADVDVRALMYLPLMAHNFIP